MSTYLRPRSSKDASIAEAFVMQGKQSVDQSPIDVVGQQLEFEPVG